MLNKDITLGVWGYEVCKGIWGFNVINVCVFEYEWVLECVIVCVFFFPVCWVLLSLARVAMHQIQPLLHGSGKAV